MADDTKASEIIEGVKKELARRSNDRVKVFNPTSENFALGYGGYKHIVPAKSDYILPRYIAQNYITKIIDQLITQENDEKVAKENKKRTDRGQAVMTPQEREGFDLRTNNEELRKKYFKQVYIGVVERYGVIETEQAKPAAAEKRPLDERLMDEFEITPEETSEIPPLKVESSDFDTEEPKFDIPQVETKKEELAREAT